MTEPLKPINTQIFGGVKVDANRVAKFSTTKQNGAKRFVIDMKDGTKIEYPAQNPKNKSRILVFDLGSGDTRVEIQNLAFGKIKGTEKKDCIDLRGCRGSEVDVSGGGSDVVMLGDNDIIDNKKSTNNKVIQDNNDTTVLRTTDYKAEYRDHYFDDVKDNSIVEVKGKGTVSEKDY